MRSILSEEINTVFQSYDQRLIMFIMQANSKTSGLHQYVHDRYLHYNSAI